MDSELSAEFKVIVGMQEGPLSSPFLFAVVIDVFTDLARDSVLNQLLYVDDLLLLSETIEGLRHRFLEWQEAFESKGLKVNLGKTKVMVCGGITNDGMSKCEVDPCGVCSFRVKTNSVLFLQCGKCIHSRCAGIKRVTPNFS